MPCVPWGWVAGWGLGVGAFAREGRGGVVQADLISGETVGLITRAFPHWFARDHAGYAGREVALPVDQHELLALVAPRPLMVGSASEDAWADPLREYLAAWHAAPVYRLHGLAEWNGTSSNLPPLGKPVRDRLRYHLREGAHDLTEVDWD